MTWYRTDPYLNLTDSRVLMQGAYPIENSGGARTGYLVLDFTRENFDSIFSGFYSLTDTILLLDAHQRPIYCSRPDYDAEKMEEIAAGMEKQTNTEDDTQYLRVNEPERGFSVILCRQAPISAPAMQTMGTVILAMSLLSLCLCLSISGILTRSIAKPVSQLDKAMEKVKDVKLTTAYRLKNLIAEKGYIASQLELAKDYAKDAYNHRYKLEGYEDLELSTQILMRDAITRGIKVDVLDRFDNFIELKDGSHVEYVKQATKTSKDSYITMLMMENKTVTKKVLERNGVNVPKGIEVTKGQSLQLAARKYAGKPAVVKPKSTNFGTGISIFTEGGSEEDLVRALEIGFEHDDTVLVEEFAKGKEYRFLVIGDEVAGILHRVPANVKGDGKSSIRELVEVKNQDSLRGKGYKTPLEKIKLDASSELFLKQKDLNFDYVPAEGEIVYLRENSNISTGGDSIDYTDVIPDRFKKIAVEAAKAMEAKFCGVDMMLEDYSDENSNYAIIELNFNPAIHIHCYPYQGTERNIGEKVLKVLGFESVECKNKK